MRQVAFMPRMCRWMAEGAQALASIAGIGSGFSPLASLRGSLGPDRLSVGNGNGPTTGATVEAGKYVSHNVYVGARQGGQVAPKPRSKSI